MSVIHPVRPDRGAPRAASDTRVRVRYYGFLDACVRWTQFHGSEPPQDRPGGDWMVFHGAHESSEEWIDVLREHSRVLRATDVHLIDFPGHGGSWTCGGRDWTLHEWAALMRAALRRATQSRSIAIAAHDLSTLPLGMALLSDPGIVARIRFVVLLDPVSWMRKPHRREVPRAVADSWPGPFETREWRQGLAALRLPVLAVFTQPERRSLQLAGQISAPFPHAEIWFKEGAGPAEVLGRIRAFEERITKARAA